MPKADSSSDDRQVPESGCGKSTGEPQRVSNRLKNGPVVSSSKYAIPADDRWWLHVSLLPSGNVAMAFTFRRSVRQAVRPCARFSDRHARFRSTRQCRSGWKALRTRIILADKWCTGVGSSESSAYGLDGVRQHFELCREPCNVYYRWRL